MTEKRALICGAGIAGPALAYWLERAGWDVTVVETADRPREGGQTVDLRGAGRTVVERMGLMERVRELAMDQRGIAWVDRFGRRRAQMPIEAFDGDGIISATEILRGDLGRVLHNATADRVDYRFGHTVTALEPEGDRVRVSIGGVGRSDGPSLEPGSTDRFDLVVGADGPHSTIRRLAFGPEEEFARPLGGYTSWFTVDDHLGLDGWYLMYNEPGGLNASIRPGREPGTAKAALSFAGDPVSYDRRDLAAQRRLIAERFAHARGMAPGLVAAAQEADDFYLDAIVQVKLDRWSRGRTTLVGDAGYCPSPLTGMGTSLGLVGAYVLAGELGAAGDDVEAGLAAYERRLRPYVKQGQQLPPGGISGYAPRTRVGLELGLFATKAMTWRPLRPLTKKLIFSHAEAIDLPDYPARVPR